MADQRKAGFNPLLKFVASFLILSFCLTTIKDPSLYAQSLSGSLHPRHGISEADPMAIIDSLTLPKELGIIQDQFLPPQSKKINQLVVYVQDAHTNYDSELNTRRLIEYFQKHYGLNLVLLEGGEGKLDNLFFKSFPNEQLKEKLLDEYLHKADLTGPEASSILSDSHDTHYYGIDSQVLYQENRKVFLEAVGHEKEINEILDQIETLLIGQAKTYFHEQTNLFWQSYRDFQSGKIDLLGYLNVSKDLIGATFNSRYPELSKLLSTEVHEKQIKDEDLSQALESMIKVLQTKLFPKLQKQKQMELNQSIQMYRIGQLSPAILFQRLKQTAKGSNVHFLTPRKLKPALKQAKTLSSVKGTKLFSELEDLEDYLRQTLPSSENEKKLIYQLRSLELLRNFSRLELLHRDWEKIQGRKPSELIQPVPGNHEELDSLFSPHYQFYDLALKRDRALFDHLVLRMRQEKTKLALVSTGGFHEEGVTKQLREHEIPYILISPQMNQIGDRALYLNAMAGKRSFMKYFQGSLWDALARDYTTKLAALLNQQEFTPSLKQWRDRIIQDLIQERRVTQAHEYTKYVDALVKTKNQGLRTEDQISEVLKRELDSYLSTYFDRIESLIKNRFTIFSSGLKDLWKTNDINPKSIATLVDRMNQAPRSGLGIEVALIHQMNLITEPRTLIQSEPIYRQLEFSKPKSSPAEARHLVNQSKASINQSAPQSLRVELKQPDARAEVRAPDENSLLNQVQKDLLKKMPKSGRRNQKINQAFRAVFLAFARHDQKAIQISYALLERLLIDGKGSVASAYAEAIKQVQQLRERVISPVAPTLPSHPITTSKPVKITEPSESFPEKEQPRDMKSRIESNLRARKIDEALHLYGKFLSEAAESFKTDPPQAHQYFLDFFNIFNDLVRFLKENNKNLENNPQKSNPQMIAFALGIERLTLAYLRKWPDEYFNDRAVTETFELDMSHFSMMLRLFNLHPSVIELLTFLLDNGGLEGKSYFEFHLLNAFASHGLTLFKEKRYLESNIQHLNVIIHLARWLPFAKFDHASAKLLRIAADTSIHRANDLFSESGYEQQALRAFQTLDQAITSIGPAQLLNIPLEQREKLSMIQNIIAKRWIRNNDYDRAERTAQFSVYLDPRNPYPLEIMADVALRKGNNKAAGNYIAEIHRIDAAFNTDHLEVRMKAKEKAAQGQPHKLTPDQIDEILQNAQPVQKISPDKEPKRETKPAKPVQALNLTLLLEKIRNFAESVRKGSLKAENIDIEREKLQTQIVNSQTSGDLSDEVVGQLMTLLYQVDDDMDRNALNESIQAIQSGKFRAEMRTEPTQEQLEILGRLRHEGIDLAYDPETGRIKRGPNFEPIKLKSTIIGVRHNETILATKPGVPRFQGGDVQKSGAEYPENALSEKGKEDAERIVKVLEPILWPIFNPHEIIRVFMSPRNRVKQTAEPTLKFFNLLSEERPGLNEILFGVWHNKNPEEIADQYGDEEAEKARAYQTLNAFVTPQGGESFLHFLDRALKELRSIDYELNGKTGVIFFHGTFASAFRILLGDPAMIHSEGQYFDWRKNLLKSGEAIIFNTHQVYSLEPSETKKTTAPASKPRHSKKETLLGRIVSMNADDIAVEPDSDANVREFEIVQQRMNWNTNKMEYEMVFRLKWNIQNHTIKWNRINQYVGTAMPDSNTETAEQEFKISEGKENAQFFKDRSSQIFKIWREKDVLKIMSVAPQVLNYGPMTVVWTPSESRAEMRTETGSQKFQNMIEKLKEDLRGILDVLKDARYQNFEFYPSLRISKKERKIFGRGMTKDEVEQAIRDKGTKQKVRMPKTQMKIVEFLNRFLIGEPGDKTFPGYLRSLESNLYYLKLRWRELLRLALTDERSISVLRQNIGEVIDEIQVLRVQIGAQQDINKTVRIKAMVHLYRIMTALRNIEHYLMSFNQKEYFKKMGFEVLFSDAESNPQTVRFLYTQKIRNMDFLFVPVGQSMVRIPIIPKQYIGKRLVLESGTAKNNPNVRVIRVYENEINPSTFLYSYVETLDKGFVNSHRARGVDRNYTFTHPLFANIPFYLNTSRGFIRNSSSNFFRVFVNADDSIRKIVDGTGAPHTFYEVLDSDNGHLIGIVVLRTTTLAWRWPSFHGVISKVPLLREKSSHSSDHGVAYVEMYDRIQTKERKFYFAPGEYAGKLAKIRMEGVWPVEVKISSRKFYLILKRNQYGRLINVAREAFMDQIGDFTGTITRFKADSYGRASLGAPLTGIQVADASDGETWMSAAVVNGVIIRTDEWKSIPPAEVYDFSKKGNGNLNVRLKPSRRPSKSHRFVVLRDFNQKPIDSYKSRMSVEVYQKHEGMITGLKIRRHGGDGRFKLPDRDYSLPGYYTGFPVTVLRFPKEKYILFVILTKDGKRAQDVYVYELGDRQLKLPFKVQAQWERSLYERYNYDLNLASVWRQKINDQKNFYWARNAYLIGDLDKAERNFKIVSKRSRQYYAIAQRYLTKGIPHRKYILKHGTNQQKRRLLYEFGKAYRKLRTVRSETRSKNPAVEELSGQNKIHWSQVSREAQIAILKELLQNVRKERKNRENIKTIKDLRKRDFYKSKNQRLQRLASRLYEYYGGHKERKGRPVITFMLERLGLIDVSEIYTPSQSVAELLKRIEAGDYTEGHKEKGRIHLKWANVSPKVQKELVEELARKLNKPVLELSDEDFHKRLESLNGQALGGMLNYYRPRASAAGKTTRWLILEATGYLPKDLLSFSQIRTASDLQLLIKKRALFGQVPWRYLQEKNREFLRNLVIELTAVAFHQGRIKEVQLPSDLYKLRGEHYINILLPNLGQTLVNFYERFQTAAATNVLTSHHILDVLFPEYAGQARTLSQLYTLESIQALQAAGRFPEKVSNLWDILPNSVQRAIVAELAKIKQKPVKRLITPDYDYTFLPVLGRTLKGMLDHYTVDPNMIGPQYLLNQIGFVRTPRSLKEHMRAIHQGFSIDDSVTPFNFEKERVLNGLKQAKNTTEIRRMLDEAILNADALLKEEDSQEGRLWRTALDAYWDILDTEEWMPSTLGFLVLRLEKEGIDSKFGFSILRGRVSAKALQEPVGEILERRLLIQKAKDKIYIGSLVVTIQTEKTPSKRENSWLRLQQIAQVNSQGLRRTLKALKEGPDQRFQLFFASNRFRDFNRHLNILIKEKAQVSRSEVRSKETVNRMIALVGTAGVWSAVFIYSQYQHQNLGSSIFAATLLASAFFLILKSSNETFSGLVPKATLFNSNFDPHSLIEDNPEFTSFAKKILALPNSDQKKLFSLSEQLPQFAYFQDTRYRFRTWRAKVLLAKHRISIPDELLYMNALTRRMRRDFPSMTRSTSYIVRRPLLEVIHAALSAPVSNFERLVQDVHEDLKTNPLYKPIVHAISQADILDQDIAVDDYIVGSASGSGVLKEDPDFGYVSALYYSELLKGFVSHWLSDQKMVADDKVVEKIMRELVDSIKRDPLSGRAEMRSDEGWKQKFAKAVAHPVLNYLIHSNWIPFPHAPEMILWNFWDEIESSLKGRLGAKDLLDYFDHIQKLSSNQRHSEFLDLEESGFFRPYFYFFKERRSSFFRQTEQYAWFYSRFLHLVQRKDRHSTEPIVVDIIGPGMFQEPLTLLALIKAAYEHSGITLEEVPLQIHLYDRDNQIFNLFRANKLVYSRKLMNEDIMDFRREILPLQRENPVARRISPIENPELENVKISWGQINRSFQELFEVVANQGTGYEVVGINKKDNAKWFDPAVFQMHGPYENPADKPKVDFRFANNVTRHVQNKEAFIKLLAQNLSPNGIIFEVDSDWSKNPSFKEIPPSSHLPAGIYRVKSETNRSEVRGRNEPNEEISRQIQKLRKDIAAARSKGKWIYGQTLAEDIYNKQVNNIRWFLVETGPLPKRIRRDLKANYRKELYEELDVIEAKLNRLSPVTASQEQIEQIRQELFQFRTANARSFAKMVLYALESYSGNVWLEFNRELSKSNDPDQLEKLIVEMIKTMAIGLFRTGDNDNLSVLKGLVLYLGYLRFHNQKQTGFVDKRNIWRRSVDTAYNHDALRPLVSKSFDEGKPLIEDDISRVDVEDLEKEKTEPMNYQYFDTLEEVMAWIHERRNLSPTRKQSEEAREGLQHLDVIIDHIGYYDKQDEQVSDKKTQGEQIGSERIVGRTGMSQHSFDLPSVRYYDEVLKQWRDNPQFLTNIEEIIKGLIDTDDRVKELRKRLADVIFPIHYGVKIMRKPGFSRDTAGFQNILLIRIQLEFSSNPRAEVRKGKLEKLNQVLMIMTPENQRASNGTRFAAASALTIIYGGAEFALWPVKGFIWAWTVLGLLAHNWPIVILGTVAFNTVGGFTRLLIYPMFKLMLSVLHLLFPSVLIPSPDLLRLNRIGMAINFVPHGIGPFAGIAFAIGGLDPAAVREVYNISNIVERSVSNYSDATSEQAAEINQHSVEIAKAIYDYQRRLDSDLDYRRFKIRGPKEVETIWSRSPKLFWNVLMQTINGILFLLRLLTLNIINFPHLKPFRGFSENQIKNLIEREDFSEHVPWGSRFKVWLVKKILGVTIPGYKEGVRPLLLIGTNARLQEVKEYLKHNYKTIKEMRRVYQFRMEGYLQALYLQKENSNLQMPDPYRYINPIIEPGTPVFHLSAKGTAIALFPDIYSHDDSIILTYGLLKGPDWEKPSAQWVLRMKLEWSGEKRVLTIEKHQEKLSEDGTILSESSPSVEEVKLMNYLIGPEVTPEERKVRAYTQEDGWFKIWAEPRGSQGQLKPILWFERLVPASYEIESQEGNLFSGDMTIEIKKNGFLNPPENSQPSRAEVRTKFDLEKTLNYIVQIFETDINRKRLPSRSELADALKGPGQTAYSKHFPLIVDGLRKRIDYHQVREEVIPRLNEAIGRYELKRDRRLGLAPAAKKSVKFLPEKELRVRLHEFFELSHDDELIGLKNSLRVLEVKLQTAAKARGDGDTEFQNALELIRTFKQGLPSTTPKVIEYIIQNKPIFLNEDIRAFLSYETGTLDRLVLTMMMKTVPPSSNSRAEVRGKLYPQMLLTDVESEILKTRSKLETIHKKLNKIQQNKRTVEQISSEEGLLQYKLVSRIKSRQIPEIEKAAQRFIDFSDAVPFAFDTRAEVRQTPTEFGTPQSLNPTDSRAEQNQHRLRTLRAEVRSDGFKTMEELIQFVADPFNWDKIKQGGLLVFDMQKTLVARKEKVSNEMIQLLAWLLEQNIRVVIDSGNTEKEIFDQLVTPLKTYLADEHKPHLFQNLTLYANSGTAKIRFHADGTDEKDLEYQRKFVLSDEIVGALQSGLKELGEKHQFFLTPEAPKLITKLQASYEADQKKRSEVTAYQLPWLEGMNYKPSVIDFPEGQKGVIVAPYIQRRNPVDGKATAFAITKVLDFRGRVIVFLRDRLREQLGEEVEKDLLMNPGGESTIDIVKASASKATALKDMVYSERKAGRPVDLNYVFYFGDEMGRTPTIKIQENVFIAYTTLGNDAVILDYPYGDSDFQNLKVVALNPYTPEGLMPQEKGRVYYIGGEQAGTQMFLSRVKNKLTASRAEVRNSKASGVPTFGNFRSNEKPFNYPISDQHGTIIDQVSFAIDRKLDRDLPIVILNFDPHHDDYDTADRSGNLNYLKQNHIQVHDVIGYHSQDYLNKYVTTDPTWLGLADKALLAFRIQLFDSAVRAEVRSNRERIRDLERRIVGGEKVVDVKESELRALISVLESHRRQRKATFVLSIHMPVKKDREGVEWLFIDTGIWDLAENASAFFSRQSNPEGALRTSKTEFILTKEEIDASQLEVALDIQKLYKMDPRFTSEFSVQWNEKNIIQVDQHLVPQYEEFPMNLAKAQQMFEIYNLRINFGPMPVKDRMRVTAVLKEKATLTLSEAILAIRFLAGRFTEPIEQVEVDNEVINLSSEWVAIRKQNLLSVLKPAQTISVTFITRAEVRGESSKLVSQIFKDKVVQLIRENRNIELGTLIEQNLPGEEVIAEADLIHRNQARAIYVLRRLDLERFKLVQKNNDIELSSFASKYGNVFGRIRSILTPEFFEHEPQLAIMLPEGYFTEHPTNEKVINGIKIKLLRARMSIEHLQGILTAKQRLGTWGLAPDFSTSAVEHARLARSLIMDAFDLMRYLRSKPLYKNFGGEYKEDAQKLLSQLEKLKEELRIFGYRAEVRNVQMTRRLFVGIAGISLAGIAGLGFLFWPRRQTFEQPISIEGHEMDNFNNFNIDNLDRFNMEQLLDSIVEQLNISHESLLRENVNTFFVEVQLTKALRRALTLMERETPAKSIFINVSKRKDISRATVSDLIELGKQNGKEIDPLLIQAIEIIRDNVWKEPKDILNILKEEGITKQLLNQKYQKLLGPKNGFHRAEVRMSVEANLEKALVPEIQLTDEEIAEYFGQNILDQSKKEGRKFYIRKLNPADDGLIGDWQRETQKNPPWYREWQEKQPYPIRLPLFDYIFHPAIGLVSESQEQERLEGMIGIDPIPTAFNSAGQMTYQLGIPQMEVNPRNVGRQGEIKNVIDVLFDFLIKFASDRENLINEGLLYSAITTGSKAFARRRYLETTDDGKSHLPQWRVNQEYISHSLRDHFNFRRPENFDTPRGEVRLVQPNALSDRRRAEVHGQIVSNVDINRAITSLNQARDEIAKWRSREETTPVKREIRTFKQKRNELVRKLENFISELEGSKGIISLLQLVLINETIKKLEDLKMSTLLSTAPIGSPLNIATRNIEHAIQILKPESTSPRAEMRSRNTFDKVKEQTEAELKKLLDPDFKIEVQGNLYFRSQLSANIFKNWISFIRFSKLRGENLRRVIITEWSDKQSNVPMTIDGSSIRIDLKAEGRKAGDEFIEGLYGFSHHPDYPSTIILNAQSIEKFNYVALHELAEAVLAQYDFRASRVRQREALARKEYENREDGKHFSVPVSSFGFRYQRRAEVRKKELTSFLESRYSPFVITQLGSEWAERYLNYSDVPFNSFYARHQFFKSIKSVVDALKTFTKRAKLRLNIFKNDLELTLAGIIGVVRNIWHYRVPFLAGEQKLTREELSVKAFVPTRAEVRNLDGRKERELHVNAKRINQVLINIDPDFRPDAILPTVKTVPRKSGELQQMAKTINRNLSDIGVNLPDEKRQIILRENSFDIAEELLKPKPNAQEITTRLRQLQTARAEVRDVIEAISAAIEDLMKEQRAKQPVLADRLTTYGNGLSVQMITSAFNEFGIPVLVPIEIKGFSSISTVLPKSEPTIFTQQNLSRDQSVIDQILGINQTSIIEVSIDQAQLASSDNPRELFRRFLETASQLVTNENIIVRAEVRGISKLASRFHRNSNDQFSVIVEGDQLIVFNSKISNFSPFFTEPASIVITSQPVRLELRRLASDFYENKVPIVFGENENVPAELLLGAAIALTRQIPDVLVTHDQKTYRLSAPGALSLMLQVLAQKTRQQSETAVAA